MGKKTDLLWNILSFGSGSLWILFYQCAITIFGKELLDWKLLNMFLILILMVHHPLTCRVCRDIYIYIYIYSTLYIRCKSCPLGTYVKINLNWKMGGEINRWHWKEISHPWLTVPYCSFVCTKGHLSEVGYVDCNFEKKKKGSL